VELGDNVSGDDQLRGPSDERGSGELADHGIAERDHESGGHADGGSGDRGIDRSDAGEPDDREGDDAAVHGDGDVHGQQHAELDGKRDVEFRNDECGDDQLCGLGKRDSGGDLADHGVAKRGDESSGHADGDGGDVGVDRVDAGESLDREGDYRAVHRNRDVHGQQHTESDGSGDVEFGDAGCGNGQFGGFGDRYRSRDVADHGDAERGDESGGHADGDGGDVGVDRGDAGESLDREGDDGAVHGDGDVHGQQHAEPDGKRDMEFWNDDGGDD